MQLCIWSLIDHSVTYIPNLKSSAVKGVEFSPNGKYLAVIVSENGQDNVDIYKTKDWKLSRVSTSYVQIKHFIFQIHYYKMLIKSV